MKKKEVQQALQKLGLPGSKKIDLARYIREKHIKSKTLATIMQLPVADMIEIIFNKQ